MKNPKITNKPLNQLYPLPSIYLHQFHQLHQAFFNLIKLFYLYLIDPKKPGETGEAQVVGMECCSIQICTFGGVL